MWFNHHASVNTGFMVPDDLEVEAASVELSSSEPRDVLLFEEVSLTSLLELEMTLS